MSPQRRDNLLLGKCFGELDHPSQVFFAIAATVVGHQLSQQRGDNWFTVSGAFAAQHLQMDARFDASVRNGESDVDGNGSLSAGRFDHGTDLEQQLVGIPALQI